MRKDKIVTITAEGRDKGKHFYLRELGAVQGEKWAFRALNAMAASGTDIPPEVTKMGLGAVAAVGLRGLLTMAFADAEPLLDEMMQCVSFLPDRSKPDVVRKLDDDDIEEVLTLLTLRSELVELHTGFSPAAFLSKLGAATTEKTPGSSNTPTSQEPSEPSSAPAEQP